jgi:hypothetical protein
MTAYSPSLPLERSGFCRFYAAVSKLQPRVLDVPLTVLLYVFLAAMSIPIERSIRYVFRYSLSYSCPPSYSTS